MTGYWTTVELQKEAMHFSAGHSTIFSATERENLHGHHYTVAVALTTWVEGNGMRFDYRFYKKKMRELCDSLDQTFLMPAYSPHLGREEDETYYYFIFNQERIPFLKRDFTILPVTNVTVEELSRWFIDCLTQDAEQLVQHRIEKIVVKVFSSPGQSASHQWERSSS